MRIAIAGYGLEGKSNYEYFKEHGDLTIVDERNEVPDLPAGVPTILGNGAFEKLQEFDLVIRTAGLAPGKIKTGGKIWSATNEFFVQCKTSIIGVTGTKGKGTTSSLIESILRAAGKKTMLIGNIGRPALDALDEANEADVIVYEMSSFQLWDLEKSPNVAVVLMIEPDHLDVHADFDDYITAKSNIRKYQATSDICFYHPTNQYSRQIAMATALPNAHCYNDPNDPRSVYTKDGAFYIADRRICGTDALQLPGAHNIENACAAISAALTFIDDYAAVERGLRAFQGLDHRLKFVREVDGVKYYDDSIATTPGSAIAAMNAFNGPKIIILGGSSKGADFSEVAEIAARTGVKHAVLIGAEADAIQRVFEKSGIALTNLGEETTMDKIVKTASGVAATGDIVILSPACASFGMFSNYKDRGDQFITGVNQL